jgi:hypothetical protein
VSKGSLARGSLSVLCTMCVLIKNNRPLLRTACTESQIQNIPTPFCRHTKDRIGQLLAYTGSWRGLQPGRGTGVEPGGLWSREFIAFISNIFRKVNTGGLLRERACFGGGGLFVPARTHFLRQKPLLPKPQNLERTWGNTDIQSDPPGELAFGLFFPTQHPGGSGAYSRVAVRDQRYRLYTNTVYLLCQPWTSGL